jgi:hypothetical protein
METQKTAVDYLGHPCKFTEAKDLFCESLSGAKNKEFREIKRTLGRLLLRLNERLSYSYNASKAVCNLMETIDDAEEPHALMEMISAYEIDTANIFYEFAGLVLAGFESIGTDCHKAESIGDAA